MPRPALLLYCTTLVLLIAHRPCAGGEVRVYRDGWGVPHIYGNTPADVMYGFGYAQAEDRLKAVLKNFLTAAGQMARVFGPEYVDRDFHQRLWKHEQIGRARYAELSPDVQVLIQNFTAGLIAYMRDHPQAKPAWAFEPEPHHVLALSRRLTWREMERQAHRDYHRQPGANTRSNQWVVGRERSAEDAVVLCVDPHREWHGAARWYEAHLHGGALHAFGFTLPGLPVFLTGHNDHLGWAAAPGGPDGADVYEIELESPTASRYRYDGEWKPIHTETVRIGVRTGGKIETRLRRMQRTHHGPILHRRGATAYAYRFSTADQVRQVEQLYRQMTASSLKEFYAALALVQTGPQRLMYGDVEGNILTIQTGRVPVRSELYQWDRPVPGNTAATAWTGIHPQADLIQALNPPPGWMQDCGASPDLIMPYSSLTPDRYPSYIFNHTPGAETPRSTRARQLLSALSRMTLQEAFDLALDTYVTGAGAWQHALIQSYASHGPLFQNDDPDLKHAVDLLIRWNGRADRDEIGTALYARWQQICRQKGRAVNIRHILSHQQLGEQTRATLLKSLGEAAAELKSTYGRLEVPWKEINRSRKGERSWGVSGSSGEGMEVLRVVSTAPDRAVNYGVSGQSCTTVILFRAPGHVESFSAVPFGHSDDPASPHSWDQAEALFSRERLKPTGYRKKGSSLPPGLKLQHTLNVPIR